MGIWDKVRDFFGSGGGRPPGGSGTELEQRVRNAMLARVARRESFVALDIANEATGHDPFRTVDDIRTACLLVDDLFHQKLLEPFGYQRTWRDAPHGNFLYQPPAQGAPTAAPPAQQPPAVVPPGQRVPVVVSQVKLGSPPVTHTKAPPPAPPAPPRPTQNPYETNPELLGLSADELRARALRIDPYRTAWIGRVDTIPPQSDERTALIDRGLLLRGLLTEQQLAEIHTVGDQWLKHHDAHRLADLAARKSADEAVEARRKERAAQKAEKKRLAAERALRRAEEIARRRREDIIYLGPGVSKGLGDRRSNVEALAAAGLPVLSTPADVAQALGLSVPRLRWLCFHNEAAERTHYTYFEIPKRSGGKRLLAAPHRTLAAAQQWVLGNILERLAAEAAAHGFIKGRSTVTNAALHLGKAMVVNLDLKDFFPSIGFGRVKGVFRRLGYSPAVATILALLCTESPRRQVELDGRKYWVAVGPRALPQGACTSPALSNQVARRLDRRLGARLLGLGWTYSRYADDLTFSAPPGQRPAVAPLKAIVRHVVADEGFALNPNKGRVQTQSGRQTVTGLVVNQKPGVPRDLVKRLRAILHQAQKTGLEAQNHEKLPHFSAWLQGMIAYVSMVDRAKGERLRAAYQAARP